MTRNYSEQALANKRRYDTAYMNEKYGTLHLSMPKDELEEIKKIITSNGFTYVEFVRLCAKLLKQGKIKKGD